MRPGVGSPADRHRGVGGMGQLVGKLATRVQSRIRDRLSATCSNHDWKVEHRIAGTPVDVVGHGPKAVTLIELEWRRADPADNAAKIFRHLAGDAFVADRVVVCQVFTRYYELASGGTSSKRQNAEFVGRVAADALPSLSYHPLDIDIDPPKRGGDLSEGWRDAVDTVAEQIVSATE